MACLRKMLFGSFAFDGQLKTFALANVGEGIQADTGQLVSDSFTLRVKNFGLEHNINNNTGHVRALLGCMSSD